MHYEVMLKIKHVHRMYSTQKMIQDFSIDKNLHYLPCPLGKYHYTYWLRGKRYSAIEFVDYFPAEMGFSSFWEVCASIEEEKRFKTIEDAEQTIVWHAMQEFKIPMIDIKEIDMSDKDCDEIKCFEKPRDVEQKQDKEKQQQQEERAKEA